MNKLIQLLATTAVAFACQTLSAATNGGILPSVCNVVWTTPSTNALGSMPLGNGDRLFLLPAWPKDWDVTFKLHVPRQTTVECVYRSGKVETLHVTPASRLKDVVMSAKPHGQDSQTQRNP